MSEIQFDFSALLSAPLDDLWIALVDAHSQLANLHERIGFLRAEEIREPKSYAKQERVQLEGHRDAFIEKKFLLIRLIENHE